MATKSAAGYTYGLRMDNPGDQNPTVTWSGEPVLGHPKLGPPAPTSGYFSAGAGIGSGLLTTGGIGDIAGAFDTAYQKGTGDYAPFPGDHSKIDQLQSLYGTVGSAYDVSGTLSALDATRKNNLLVGQNAASTAANQFQSTALPGGSSAAGASMLRAQALLPFLQNDTSAAADEGKYADSAKQQALSTSADIATKLAQLEQSYTDSLASYNSDKARSGLDYAQGQVGLQVQDKTSSSQSALEALRLQMQAVQNSQQFALQTRQLNLAQNQPSASTRAAAVPAARPTSEFYYVDNLGRRMTGSPPF